MSRVGGSFCPAEEELVAHGAPLCWFDYILEGGKLNYLASVSWERLVRQELQIWACLVEFVCVSVSSSGARRPHACSCPVPGQGAF